MSNFEDDLDDSCDNFADDDSETLSCPACGADVYEDADRCPHCGEYIIAGSTSPLAGRSPWWIALGVAGVVALILALLFSI